MRHGGTAFGVALAMLIALVAIGCGGDSETGSLSTTATGASGVAGATGEGGAVGAGEVDVTFQQPKGAQNALGAKLLQAGGLDNLANVLSDTFELPDDLTVRGVNGFGPGPYFNPKDDSINYPYLFSTLV